MPGYLAPDRALEALIDAARAPLSEWPARYPGRRAMGYLCSYVPAEIIHAAGFSPVRLRGDTTPLRWVDAHLQSFTCALCRSTLDRALSGSLDFLAGTVFAHTCDTMQAQADLWRMNLGMSHFVDTVAQPASLGTSGAHRYLVAELNRFRERLVALVGQAITDDDLRASIALYDDTRQMVQAVQGLRSRVSIPQFFAILDAAQIMPPENFNALAVGLLAELEVAPVRRDGPRLFLVGATLDEPRLLDLLEELGARVVGDDLCSGSRHFHDRGGTGHPIDALAEYYLRRPPCPSKLHPLHEPGRYLMNQLRTVRAQGVVFVIEKFCEPHAFDYASVLPPLDRARVPHLLLELEQTPSLEALRTRLQAFIEIL